MFKGLAVLGAMFVFFVLESGMDLISGGHISSHHVSHFYVSCYCGITLRRLREQLLLQNYKTQRHAVFLFKDALTVEDNKSQNSCRCVCSSVPQSHYK